MSTFLNETDIRNVIVGATLLGGGGGGSIQNGFDLLDKYKEEPGREVSLELIDPSEMAENAYMAVTAGMGAPKALIGVDFTPYALNSYNSLVDMAAKMGRELKYSCAVEMGGFNTFVPMLISMVGKLPFIDADGAGRAVPALDTLLLHVNGCDTSPLAMADKDNNRVEIVMADARNAALAEILGRNTCISFGMISGLSGWMLDKKQVEDCIATGTITLAKEYGALLSAYTGEGNVFDYLAKHKDAKAICSGEITKVDIITKDGFDYGVVYIKGDDGKEYTIPFQNENLVITQDAKPILTAPDIIAFYDKGGKLPLTNADVKEGMKVDIGAIRVTDKWWKQPEADVEAIWGKYFKNVGYEGKIIKM